MKARIAMMGLNARVEQSNVNGKTLYRVRLGPYDSASDADRARQSLSSNGVQSMPIEVK